MAERVPVASGDAPDVPNPGPGAPAQSANDSTVVPGQNPASLFGIEISYDSGAPGSATAYGSGENMGTVNQPGQYPAKETISGVALDGSGAPGDADGPELHGGPAGRRVG